MQYSSSTCIWFAAWWTPDAICFKCMCCSSGETATSSTHIQQVNVRFLIVNTVDSNEYGSQDCSTNQLLQVDFFMNDKKYSELRWVMVERKLSDAFKECVG